MPIADLFCIFVVRLTILSLEASEQFLCRFATSYEPSNVAFLVIRFTIAPGAGSGIFLFVLVVAN